MNFPIRLYDINNNLVSRTHISKTNCFYFRSYQNFNVEIISGTGALFSVVKKQHPDLTYYLETSEAQNHVDNFGYTLYIPDNNSIVNIRVSSGLESTNYLIMFKDSNIIDETNEHYKDLLVNYNLPSYDQISKALLEDFDKTELLKRLLLDFRHILSTKGTKQSVENFLIFIGFKEQSLKLMTEYTKTSTGESTLEPDKAVDTKTGNYHLLYNNYEETELDSKNMPVRINHIDDLSVFFETLKYAISLANTYFTLEEQNITFVGITYSSNVVSLSTMNSTMNVIFEADPIGFRKDVKIYLTNNQKNVTHFLVNNCLPKLTDLLKSEVKVLAENYDSTKIINKIDSEITDTSQTTNIESFIRIFGIVLNLNIRVAQKYVEYFISQEGEVVFHFDKVLCAENAGENFLAFSQSGSYNLLVNITDTWNNTEQYTYDFEISKALANIDFETFNSSIVNNASSIIEDINLDVDSPTEQSLLSSNYVLPQALVPADLSHYYETANNPLYKQLTENSRYVLESINPNWKVDDVSETIPVELSESWIEILSIPYNANTQLGIKVFDKTLNAERIISFTELAQYDPIFDCLYVVVMDVVNEENSGIVEPWYFITTTEVGISLNKNTFNLFIQTNDLTFEQSVFDMPYQVMKLAVNYDIPLFKVVSELAPNFISYVSPCSYNKIIEGVSYPMMKTIFSRIINIVDDLADTAYELNLGDIVLCRLDSNLVVNEVNVVWKVINSFTNLIVYTTSDYMLKYRIEEQAIYNVTCEFEIGGQTYKIEKPSLFSSFKSQLFI